MQLIKSDCLFALKTLPENSIDSLITDPPAGISFMGKSWDDNKGGRDQWITWLTEVMVECMRVMKPGAHGLVWALPRTSHWTATALENAGFEVKDQIFHLFGSGFPKSLDIKKSAIKQAIACECRTSVLQYHNEDLQYLSEEMGTKESLPRSKKQNMLKKLRGKTCKADLPDSQKDSSKMSDLQKDIQTQEQDSLSQSKNMFTQVSGCEETKRPRGYCAPSTDFVEREAHPDSFIVRRLQRVKRTRGLRECQNRNMKPL